MAIRMVPTATMPIGSSAGPTCRDSHPGSLAWVTFFFRKSAGESRRMAQSYKQFACRFLHIEKGAP
jgi:hypothetical protein